MSTSDEMKTHAELDSDNDFIQYLEALLSGTLDTGTGINRPLGRLARNTDALLETVQGVKVQPFSQGGGTITWDGSNLTFSSTFEIAMLNEIEGTTINQITTAQSPITLAGDGAIAFVQLNRTTQNAQLTVQTTTNLEAFRLAVLTDDADRLDWFIVAMRVGTSLVLWDGRRVRSGFSLTNSGFTDTQYAQQSEVTQLRSDTNENNGALLTGGGIVSWDTDTNTFTWTADLVIDHPGAAGRSTIAASSLVVAAGNILYVDVTRLPGSDNPVTLTSAVPASVPTTNNIFVIAKHNADDSRLYLRDGTALTDGDQVNLGGLRTGVQWFYRQPGDSTQVTDLTESGTFPTRTYRIGAQELMVYRNGTKAKASLAYWSGAYPVGGSLITTNGALEGDDEYVELDTDADGRGDEIIWMADGQAASEPLFHTGGGLTWPTASDKLEIFIGVQGEGTSPVDSIGKFGESETLEGAVKLEEGSNVTITRSDPNNSYIIGASITAGVASVSGETGVLTLVGGNNITVQPGVPAAGSITLDGDVTDFEDLGDISTDLSASVRNAVSPSTSNIVLTSNDVVAVSGFDKIWSRSLNRVATTGGVLRVGSTTYRSYGAELSANVGNIVPGDTLVDNEWFAIYVGPGASPGGDVSLFLSPVFPDLTANGAAVHPTQAGYAYIGSVYRESGNLRAFTKVGDWTYLDEPWDLTARFGTFPNVAPINTNFLDSGGMDLETKVSPTAVKLQFRCVGAGTVPLERGVIFTGRDSGVARQHSAIMAQEAGGGASFIGSFDIEIPVEVTGGAWFDIRAANGIASLDSVVCWAYADGRYTTGDLTAT